VVTNYFKYFVQATEIVYNDKEKIVDSIEPNPEEKKDLWRVVLCALIAIIFMVLVDVLLSLRKSFKRRGLNFVIATAFIISILLSTIFFDFILSYFFPLVYTGCVSFIFFFVVFVAGLIVCTDMNKRNVKSFINFSLVYYTLMIVGLALLFT
jgi:predicted neutral ceramidase superfamily lipid hydrolase